MDTSLPSAVKHLDGARLIVKPLNKHLSKKEKVLNTTAAKLVEWWLNDPKNKLTMWNQLCQSEVYGTGIGIIIGNDVLSKPINFKSFVKVAIKRKRAKKIR